MKSDTEILEQKGESAEPDKNDEIRISVSPANLISKEGFALYVGKSVRAVVEMAKANKIPAFYMANPANPGGHAELWISRREWDEYEEELVAKAPPEWHDWKNRLSYSKPSRKHKKA